LASTPYLNDRIGFQGEFGGVGVNTTIEHLWNDQQAINHINETYEIDANNDIWNYRALRVIEELREQTEMFDCNGGVYTQTTDVEGEVNGPYSLCPYARAINLKNSLLLGFLTYDREVDHTDQKKWKKAIRDLYQTFDKKVNGKH
jgi:hypothetical protein